MRASVLIFFLLIAIGVKAQLNYKTVDSTSYALYAAKQWKELADYGENANKNGLDYYYLNLRIGIANYELGRFYKAEQYFKKAQEKNSVDKVAPEYLFWIYNQTNREPEAAEMYKLLPDTVQSIIGYTPKKLVESIYLEGGTKISGNTDIAKTLAYGNFGIRHKISPNINIYHSYTYIQQKLNWGEYKQHQYYFAPSFNLKKGWEFDIGVNYFNYERIFDYRFENLVDLSHTELNGFVTDSSALNSTQYVGSFNQNAYGVQLALSKTIRNFSFKPQIAWFGEQNKPNYQEILGTEYYTIVSFNDIIIENDTSAFFDVINYKEPSTTNYFQFGGAIDYTYRFNKKLFLTFGLETQALFNKEITELVFAPYFNAILGSKISLSGYYMNKGNYPISLFSGSTIMNSYDKLNHRLSLTGKFDLSKKLSLYSTFQWEDKEDSFSLETYKSYSILIGTKIKF